LYYMYFAMLGLTVLLFTLSYYRSPISMACLLLMLLSLYLLVVSDIVNFTRTIPGYRGEPGSDIKDPRFFGTIAAFPALHLLLTWMRREQGPLALGPICLIGQAAVFAFVIQIRWPVIWLLFALYGYCFIRLLSSRGSPHLQSPRSIRSLVLSLLFAV